MREELDLTLANVAQHAGISPGMLSRLETGRVSPSLETIVALAEALGVRPALLLQEVGEYEGSAQHVPEGQGLEVVRRGTKRGHTYHLLAAQRGPAKVFEPFLVTLTDKSEVFPGFQHAGTEFIYILVGRDPLSTRQEQFPAQGWGFADFPRRYRPRAGAAGQGADTNALDYHLWRRGNRLSASALPAAQWTIAAP